MDTETLSPVEKLVLVIAIIFGLVVHFYDLNLLSGWSDEFASMYFADHLSAVYAEETHPPLFYFFLKPFLWKFGKDLALLRAVISTTSLALMTWACFLAKKLYGLRGAILLGILLCFSPVELVHSRMVRQYSIYFELTAILILLALIPNTKLIPKAIVAFILSGIHPIGFFPVIGVALYQVYSFRKLTKESLIFFSMAGIVFLYYVSKMIFLPGKEYLSGYLSHRDLNFYLDVLRNISGEHYPKINMHPVPLWFVVLNVILALTLISTAIKKKNDQAFMMVIFFWVFSLLSAEVISLIFVNIKLGRYFSFLSVPILIATVILFYRSKHAIPIAFAFGLLTMTVINPVQFYPGEREMIGSNLDLNKTIFCANKFQFYYYLGSKKVECAEQFKEFLEKKKDFVYVDLNGYGYKELIKYLKFYNISNFYLYGIPSSAIGTYRPQKR